MGYDPILCEPHNLGRSQNQCNSSGTSLTDHCSRLYVDVGANNGQSLHFWYHSSDAGRGCTEFGHAVPWQDRRLFCADVFEAEPSQTRALRKEVAYHHSRGRNVHLYDSTPFSLNGGDVVFKSIGRVDNAGGSIGTTPANAGVLGANDLVLHSMGAIKYLFNLKATHLVLKIDVENYEFELLRGLVVSGALCVPLRKTDIFVEWHVPRFHGPDQPMRHLFNETEFGLPHLNPDSKENKDAFAVRDAMIWMLQSPACANTTHYRWW